MEKTTVSRLEPSLRDELEALLKKQPTPEFESDFQDMLVPKLFGLLLGVAALVGSIYDLSTEYDPLVDRLRMLVEYPMGVVRSPSVLGLFIAPLLIAWTATRIAQNVGRCGFAALSTCLMVLRGRKVKVLKYADIADVSTRSMRTKKQSWTALDLKLKDGRSETLHVHGRWVAEVMKRLGCG